MGDVTGQVLDSVTHLGVSNVTVAAVSLSGGICVNCNSTNTSSSGAFTLPAAAGPVEVTFTTVAPYLDNETWTTVPNGSTVSVGTVYLVHDAHAVGFVESTVPGHPPIGGVLFTAVSRDGTITAHPFALSASNGSFDVPIPPVPSTINFAYDPASNGNRPSPFLANWTYANATPYATVDLGAVYLEGGVPVHAELWDRVTDSQIASTVSTQLTVCTDRGAPCLAPVTGTLGGGDVPGWGVPGPAYVVADALGYVENRTWVPDILNSNASVDLGRVYLEPLGGVELSFNLTGGTPSTSGWAAGTQVNVTVCSLDGLLATQGIPGEELGGGPCTEVPGIGLNETKVVPATPLRDAVLVAETHGFPVATLLMPVPPWPWPNVESNITRVNVTPGQVLSIGSVDFAPGTLLAGNVSIDGQTANLSGRFGAQTCSTDEPGICLTQLPTPPTGCPTASNSFCVPAPPGPVELSVTAPGNVTVSSATNRTWLTVPRGCCAQDGHPTWVGTINLTTRTTGGTVYGEVDRAGPAGSRSTPLTGSFASVQVCALAPPAPGASSACGDGSTDPLTGQFNLSAPDGWDQVTVSAGGFAANWTWVFVNGTNASGTIVLAPEALVHGRVVDPAGHGIYDAYVRACPASDADLCPAQSGLRTNTAGEFNLSIAGLPFPGNAYEIYVSGSGYTDNWTWVNASTGRLVDAGSIQLAPATGAAPGTPRLATAGGNVWISGRVIDDRNGLGVGGVSLEACPIPGTACTLTAALIPLGGGFNFSLPRGAYDLVLNATNYVGASVYLNATGGALDLGALRLDPFAWVRGRVAISPWEGLETSLGLGVGGAAVAVCDSAGRTCGAAGITASDGSFNVSAPLTSPATLTILGGGQGYYGSSLWGFDPGTESIAVAQNYTILPSATGTPLTTGIFGEVQGTLRDGRSWNQSTGAAPAGAGFSNAQGWVYGPSTGYALAYTGGGGGFALFLPSAGTETQVIGGGAAYLAANQTRAGSLPSASLTDLGDLTLTHYGWIHARVVDASSLAPVSGVTVTASRSDPANATTLVVDGVGSEDGFVNVSAPPGPTVSLTVRAPGYSNVTVTVAVSPEATSSLGTVQLTLSSTEAPAWVQSREVNTVGRSPTVTVMDGLTHQPLPFAQVHASSPTGAGSTPLSTNGLGQFLLSAPPGDPDSVTWTVPNYQTVTAAYRVTAGSRTVVDRVNVTGDGVVAGRVVVSPGGIGAAGVTVEGCDLQGACSALAYANGAGYFWIAVAPGFEEIRVSTEQYLANVSGSATVTPDSWTWIGAIPVYAFASLTGSVRALPSGLPIANATVSLCSALGVPWGPCGASVPTDASGRFSVSYPPGRFVFVVSARFYNTTYFPLSLVPGGSLALGTIFLLEWGGVAGSVRSQVDGHPIPGAWVEACATWSASDCSPTVTTNGTGDYLLLAPPGPVTLLAGATAYADALVGFSVAPGELTTAPPITLVPLAPEVFENLTGTVVSAATGAPVPGAFVALESGGRAVAATTAASDGSFRVGTFWGDYTLRVAAPGYAPIAQPVALHSNVSGLRIALHVFTFLLSGTVHAADTGRPLAGVEIESAGTALGTSDAAGGFEVDLANGSYTLLAVPPLGVPYVALAFSITIDGAAAVRTLSLTPSEPTLSGVVVDALSGLPVPYASVTLYGSALATSGHNASLIATISGGFELALPSGSYVLNASAPGYLPASVAVTVTNTSLPVTVPLEPVGAAVASGVPLLPLVLGVGGAGVAIGVGLLLYRRRRRPRIVYGEIEGSVPALPAPSPPYDDGLGDH